MILSHFCRTISCHHLLFDVTKGWRRSLQHEFEPLRSYFKPMDRLARIYPGENEYEKYRIVIHRDGTIVGIDDEDDDNRIELTRQDIVFYEFDRMMFRQSLCTALGLHLCATPVQGMMRTIPVGTWEPEKSACFTANLLLPGMFNLRDKVLERIVEKSDSGEVLLLPPRNHWDASILSAAKKNNLLLVPLDEVICLEDGQIIPTPEWDEYLTAFCKMVDRDLPSRFQKKTPEFMLAKRGAWVFRFKNMETLAEADWPGPAFVQYLLQNPGTEFHVEKLWQAVMGTPTGIPSIHIEHTFAGEGADVPNSLLGGSDDILDATAKKSYETRLKELAVERKQAEVDKDLATLERIENEFELIRCSLEQAGGGIRQPKKLGDSVIRLRDRIRRGINAFIDHISANDPEGGQYLRKTIKRGNFMKYVPLQTIEWITS